MVHVLGVSPPFPFAIHKGALVHDGREDSFSLFSDGVIRNGKGDATIAVQSTSTCSRVSENKIVTALSAQLWSEAISAVAADLALHPDDRAHSADQMIRRYRFDLLQTILVHHREPGTLRWHIPREITGIIGAYCFVG
jgi:hypothetical protein